MNWLAHVFLSKPSIHFRLGNLLADMMKGRAWEGIHPDAVEGMLFHRKIDAFTDEHRKFAQSKGRLGSSGFLRGVVIDLAYDHMLTRHWDLYTNRSLEAFLNQFHEEAREALGRYPEEAKGFVLSLIESNRLGTYGEKQSLRHAMKRVDERLSSRVLKKEDTSRYYEPLVREYDELERDFLVFFPELLESLELRHSLQ